MANSIFDSKIEKIISAAQAAYLDSESKDVEGWEIKPPFPSPTDWRDHWIYMLMIDRFNNPKEAPKFAWNKIYDYRQGGTFNGVTEQLDYLKGLGVGAIWITPVLKNVISTKLKYNYHGYNIQDFLNIDGRFASDGHTKTAEKELRILVDTAHQKEIYVILDIVINHSGRVFDYFKSTSQFLDCEETGDYTYEDKEALGIKWARWKKCESKPYFDDNDPILPNNNDNAIWLEDDAIWPEDLRQAEWFRRRGKWDSNNSDDDYTKGDFCNGMRQFLFYPLEDEFPSELRSKYGENPAFNILIRCHEYLIAKYDFDGFRIDTAKHISPKFIEIFGNAMREFALSIGKKNFFTFGEIAVNDSLKCERRIAAFVGRNKDSNQEGFGIDSALDYPLFHRLIKNVKGLELTYDLPSLFEVRRTLEKDLLNSHGEASRFFVTFIDNHDQHGRFFSNVDISILGRQLTLALGLLFCLPGIPCLYYGTEQGLSGTEEDEERCERVREALWGKDWSEGEKNAAFDKTHDFYKSICCLSKLREGNPALRYGRCYFREISGNGKDFGLPYTSKGDVIAFSRILSTQEILIVANTANKHTENESFKGYVIVAVELYSRLIEQGNTLQMEMVYSNLPGKHIGQKTDIQVAELNFYKKDMQPKLGKSAMIAIELDLIEVQIWKLSH